jgi:hypothetical protein
MAIALPLSVLGLNINGDLAGMTIYTRADGRKVMFPASPANKPPSPLQQLQRDRFRAALSTWRALPTAQKEHYENASLCLSLCATGLNVWISLCLADRGDLWKTLCVQSHLPLVRPPAL